MIVELLKHPRHDGILLIKTPSELAHTMGRFAPARRSDKDRGYLLPVDQLENFQTFIRIHGGHQIVDNRETAAAQGVALGPLPECAECGQPARRAAALTMRICPACGAPWRIAEDQPGGPVARASTTCPGCRREQRGRFPFCSDCGAAMPPPPPIGAFQIIPPRPRERLEDPVAFGSVLAGTDPDGAPVQLPIDQEETQ